MKTKIRSTIIVLTLIFANVIAVTTLSEEGSGDQIQWPTSWILIDSDPAENGDIDDYRDVQYAFYNVDNEYLYFRLECYASPNFTTEPEGRYKWFIDIDDPYNMGQSGGNVYDAKYLLFVEDSPKPGGDGIGDIYLLEDVDGDGFIDNDWPDYLITPGKITDSSIASYRIVNNCLDVCIRLENISNPTYSYFTWATDQENPNLDQAPDIDRSNNYWDTNISKADISIVKTDSADQVYPGEAFNYSLLVTNHGPHIAYNVNVTDEIPANLVFNSATPLPSGGSLPNVFWNIPMLSVGQSYEILIDVTVSSSFTGVITNTAVANNDTYDPIPGNNQDAEETTVIETADLSIEKTASADTVVAGDNLTYLITVTNNGPHAAENIIVSDTLPANVTFLSANPAPTGNAGLTYNWNLTPLNYGESFIIEVNVSVDAMGTIVNTAQISSDTQDLLPDNNEDRVETNVRGIADLIIEKSSEFSEPAHAGSLIVYTINVTNHGPDNTTNVSVVDILPDGVTFVDAVPMFDEVNGSEYRWVIASINVNESVILRVNVTVNDSFSGTITNLAYVEDDSYDPDESNNEDDEDVTVDEEEDDDDAGSGGGGGNPGGGSSGNNLPPENEEPTAKTDGPYYATVDEKIQFNATESHDNDENGESIVRYDWKFSDEDEWDNDSGATPIHIYNKAGKYNVSLRVFDDENTSNINTTFVIIAKLNSPPGQPEVTGPENGTQNVSYNFTVVSTDEDGDKIKYTIDWGDGNTTESNFLPSGVPFSTAYKWEKPGEYQITVTADDNSTISTEELTIEINEPEPDKQEAEKGNILLPLILLLLLFLIILLFLLDKRRRDKKEGKQKITKSTAKPKIKQTAKQ